MASPGPKVFIGIAGWSIASPLAPFFERKGSHLERYAQRFNAVEINSSFYRHHRSKTYAKWAASVPEGFRFSVKLARIFTHERKLNLDSEGEMELRETLAGIEALGAKLGPLLVQLPPSLEFEETTAQRFFNVLASAFTGVVVAEPRHRSWRTEAALALLNRAGLTLVFSDPSPIYRWEEYLQLQPSIHAYSRLHGTPVIYRSEYGSERIEALAGDLLKFTASAHSEVWCIFDNTALGHAIPDALKMQAALSKAANVAHPTTRRVVANELTNLL